MALHIVSLLAPGGQEIPNDGKYHIVRFPYDDDESYDPWGMHSPGSVSNWATDDRSGLIHPVADGWGWLTAMLYVERGGYSEVRDRFVRDPLGQGHDSTATEDHAPTGGGQYRHKSHEIFVHPDTPLAYMVRFPGASGSTRLLHAQFKLAIGTDVVAP